MSEVTLLLDAIARGEEHASEDLLPIFSTNGTNVLTVPITNSSRYFRLAH